MARPRAPKPFRVALLLAALGLAASIGLFGWIHAMETRAHADLFAEVFDSQGLALKQHAERHLGLLQSLAAVFRAQGAISRDEFSELVAPSLGLHPDLQFVQWVPRVAAQERTALETAARRDGFEYFRLTEDAETGGLIGAGRRALYLPGFYVEPYRGNELMLGFDWRTDPAVHGALQAAWQSNAPVATPLLRLRTADNAAGLIVAVPVYRPGSLSFVPSGRAQGLVGLVVAGYRADLLLHRAFAGLRPAQAMLVLRDAEQPGGAGLLAQGSAAAKEVVPTADTLRRTIDIAGRKWVLEGTPSKAFRETLSHATSTTVLALGILATLWLASYGYRRQHRLQQIEVLVEERTAQLTANDARLRRSLAANQAIIDAIPVGLITCDRGGRVRHANPAALALLGKERSELLGSRCRDNGLCPTSDGRCPVRDGRGNLRQMEHVLTGAGGIPIPVLKTVEPVILDEEELLLETFVDIKPLKDAHLLLARESERNDALNQLLGASLSCVSPKALLKRALRILDDLEFVGSESGAAFLTHPERAELILIDERGLPEALHKTCASVQFGRCFCGRAAADGQLIRGRSGVPEHENGYAGMPERHFYSIPVLGSDGVAGMLVLYLSPGAVNDRDMSAFMQAVSNVLSSAMQRLGMESNLETARANAEAASRAKSRFLANMSHEIRTPLNGVLGMAELLAESPLDADQRGYLEAIDTCGQTLLEMITRILDFSELDGSGVQLRSEELDLQALLRQAVDHHRGRASARGLELLLGISPGCPHRVYGDAARLRQLLDILLDNALKFTEKGTVSVELKAAPGDADRPRLRLTVEDTGIGIAADRQAQLFEPFTQADASTTRPHDGAGIGLALAKRVVDLMGGTIAMHSVPGQGTRVDIRFALAPAEQTADRPSALA
ncbi:MAG: CHASE domain-containing protein [Thiohalocapsa sp.]|nr:CHASE domain-containing protein [Thiohalocapsa sp.]MCF7989314.1 CHASE domain-containing protein [Thiohalocapsa sp.]